MSNTPWKLTVYKYPFPVRDEFTIEMPEQAKLLHVETQNGTPCLWALVHTGRPITSRRFRLAGTGHPITAPAGVHVGTFFMAGGELVWHLFDDGEVSRG